MIQLTTFALTIALALAPAAARAQTRRGLVER
jgi:hypothetical protein